MLVVLKLIIEVCEKILQWFTLFPGFFQAFFGRPVVEKCVVQTFLLYILINAHHIFTGFSAEFKGLLPCIYFTFPILNVIRL